MTGFFLHIINQAIPAGLLVPIVLALRLLLRRSPKRIRPLLWALVALRLLLPISVESESSLVPSVRLVSSDADVQADERIVIETGVPSLDEMIRSEKAQEEQRAASVMRLRIAGIVWLAGSLLMLACAFARILLVKRRLRASLQWKADVYFCDDIGDAFLFGFFSPRIYLPSGMDDETRRLVLTHERAHIARGDHILKPLAYLLLCVFWFHPLLWLAYVLFCRDLEYACDERAVRTFGPEGKAAYCDALLACSRSLSAGAGPLSFGAGPVRARVCAVLHAQKPSRLCGAVGMLVGILATVYLMTAPKAAILCPFPDLTNPEQLYGTWTLSQISYRTYPDEDPMLLQGGQLDNRLYLTFCPDGVVHLLTDPGCHETVGQYEITADNTITIWGKEQAGKKKVLHLTLAVYHPDSDTLSISPRALYTESFSRSVRTDSAPQSGAPAALRIPSLSSCH